MTENRDFNARCRRVVLVGSSRFKAVFHEVAERLEKQGVLVLMMGFFQHADGVSVSEKEREVLERVDRQRIELADEVLVINVDGYVGHSTRKEIAHAQVCGKPIRFLDEERAWQWT